MARPKSEQTAAWRRLLWRILTWLGLGGAAIEALTVASLQIASKVRKVRRELPGERPAELPATLVGDDALQIYTDGEALYRAMLEAIQSARDCVYLETFIWKADDWGQRFKDCLIRKAREGVQVYAIYDKFANLVVPPPFKRFPPEVHAMAYTGFHQPAQALDPRSYALDHRKLLVVDGRTGFLGGYNIGSVYADTWRDTHVKVEGPTAADLADAFVAFWDRHGPPDDRIGRRFQRRFNPILRVEGTNALRLTFPIRNMYVSAIDRAERSISLTNAYFVPDSTLVEALMAAAARGVNVRILVPWVSNHVVADWLSRTYFAELMQAGARIYRYRSMLHSKTCTIDGVWSTIGTANLDRLSAVGNYEINLEIYSAEVARQMERIFEADLAWSGEVDQATWLERPGIAKLGETLVSPLRSFL